MEGAIFKASWPAGPDVLVLPERDGSTSARDLVIQALSATMLLADRQLPQAVVLASGPWNLKARELRAIAETMAEKGVTLEQHHKRYVTLVQQLYRAHAHECYGKEQPELQVW